MIFSVRRAQCIIPHKVTRNAIPTRSCHRMLFTFHPRNCEFAEFGKLVVYAGHIIREI